MMKRDFDELYLGGDGTSLEKAVKINAPTTSTGIAAEYEYVARIHGRIDEDWELELQALMDRDDKKYDVLYIRLREGRRLAYFFDITGFFGK